MVFAPYLFDERHVLFMVGLRDCPAFPWAVLMAVHSGQTVGLAVEEESLFGVDGEIAQSDALRQCVGNLFAVHQFVPNGVAVVGCFFAPQGRMLYLEITGHFHFSRRHSCRI